MTHRSLQNPARQTGRIASSRKARIRLSTVTIFALAVLILSGWARGADTEADRLAGILELKPGSSVADVGAGSGDMSIALASQVAPGGIVYSTEIDPKLLEKIRNAVKKAGVRNVIVITAKQHRTGLPRNSCDAIFLREVYHHLVDPSAIDRSLFRAMRPGGRLAVIDFEPIPGDPAAPGVPVSHGKNHGVTRKIVEQEVGHSGFRLVSVNDWPATGSEKLYCVLFRKPSLSPAGSAVSQ
jgi:predicted methyltransferase